MHLPESTKGHDCVSLALCHILSQLTQAEGWVDLSRRIKGGRVCGLDRRRRQTSLKEGVDLDVGRVPDTALGVLILCNTGLDVFNALGRIKPKVRSVKGIPHPKDDRPTHLAKDDHDAATHERTRTNLLVDLGKVLLEQGATEFDTSNDLALLGLLKVTLTNFEPARIGTGVLVVLSDNKVSVEAGRRELLGPGTGRFGVKVSGRGKAERGGGGNVAGRGYCPNAGCRARASQSRSNKDRERHGHRWVDGM